jgi:hypothetical protein
MVHQFKPRVQVTNTCDNIKNEEGSVGKYCHGIWIDGLRKAWSHFSQENRPRRRGLNMSSLEYETKVLLTRPRRSVICGFDRGGKLASLLHWKPVAVTEVLRKVWTHIFESNNISLSQLHGNRLYLYVRTAYYNLLEYAAKFLSKSMCLKHICVAQVASWTILIQCNPLFRDQPYPRPMTMPGRHQAARRLRSIC